MARGNQAPVAAKDRGRRHQQAHTTATPAPMAPPSTAPSGRHDPRPRPDLRAPLDPPGRPSLRRDHLGVPDRRHRQRVGQERLRAEGRRGPRLLEPARHQRRRQQVLPRPPRHAGARDLRPPADRPRRQHDHGLGGDPALLRDGRRPPDLQGRADPPDRPPEDGVQLAGLVQRRHRREAAVLRVLHQLGRRTRCPRSWTSPRPRRCSSSSAPARAATSPPSAPPSEKMAGGGTASGPVSFMKGYDAFAGVVKSGGKTRRAAKMVILDAGHPDVLEFIDSKAHEEQKAWALIEAGYDPSFTGEAYGSVFFQNANHSVRVTDEFMQAVVDDGEWQTHAVVEPHEVMDTYKRPRHLPQDGRGRPPLRRPGHPVRHDHQRVAHLGQHGPDPRVQPVLRVHVPQRHRVQPGHPQPHEVRRRETASSTSRPTASRPR